MLATIKVMKGLCADFYEGCVMEYALIILAIAGLIFLIEVVWGSSTEVHNPELGLDVADWKPERLAKAKMIVSLLVVCASVGGMILLIQQVIS